MALNIDKEIFIALSRVYLPEFIRRTPGTGVTSKSWDLEMRGGAFVFSNPRGEIVLYLEEGTQPHIIRPKNKKALRWTNDSGIAQFAKYVNHPGFAARKFIESIIEDENLYIKFSDVLWGLVENKIVKAFK